MKTRTNYGKVISILYRALYSDYKLSDRDLKLIINYVMEEYLGKVGENEITTKDR